MRYLGIDYGGKRVGVALSDELGLIAFPHSIIQNSSKLIDSLLKLCADENVERVVIGESKDLNGQRNDIMDAIDVFITEWKKQSNVPIFLEPEFLTSHQAQKIQGKNDMIDASAAAIILQSYLERKL